MECIFCKIALHEIESRIIYEDEKIIAFSDLKPVAPVHFLVIPKQHLESCNSIDIENSHIISHIFEKIPKIRKELKLDEGYRVVTNCGKSAGQQVPHLHFHVLGGRKMSWPPG